jgi:ABC-type transport system involved in cytochrome c biogenesis permease component
VSFLPIVERELRVAARRRGTYWLRLLVAFGLVLIAAWIFLASKNDPQHQIGQMMFYTLTGGLMVYCLLAGLRSTADCLSEEKREGTLGLLFLTDLRGYDVIIGKLTANSLAVFYCVIAVLPVLAIPLLLGGVAGAEFGRISLVLVNTLFFSLCAGMLASAMCRNGRAAIIWTLLLILLVAAGGPVLGLALWWTANWRGNYPLEFLLPSPVFSYFAGVDTFFARSLGKGFYVSVGIVHVLAWVYLGLASLIAPRSWQDRPSSPAGARRSELLRTGMEGDADVQRAFRSRLLNRNAFFWLATRPRSRALWAWVPLAVAALAWSWGMLKFGRDWNNTGVYLTTGFLLSVTIKGYIGAECGRRLVEDRKIGAMELLLSTPLSVRQILHGQFLALQRQFFFPVLVMFVVDVWLLIAGLSSSWLNSSSEQSIWLWMWLAGMVMFIADVTTLYWLGMWTGLAMRNPKHAFGAAITPVLALPWIGLGVVMTIIELLPLEMRRSFRWDGFPLLVWFVLGITVDLLFGLNARRNLLLNFRLVAAQRYQPRPSWWQRWFGKGDVPEGQASEG